MWRSGFKWMFLIMGTIIGAGYASGRELWEFFGDQSGLAIILFTLVFSISCYIIMKISYEKKSEHFSPVLRMIIGKRLSYFYEVLIIIYLFSTTIVMLAGGGATLEMFHIPYFGGIILFSILLVLLFIWDIKGMISINAFLIPLLIIGLVGILLSFLYVNGQSFTFNPKEQSNWPTAFTFSALNILPLVAVISAIGKEIQSRGEALVASIGSGIVLGIISFIYNESLIQIANKIVLYEIPLFAIIENYPYIVIMFMSFILWAAIYTTAASGLFGLSSRFREKVHFPLWMIAAIILIAMIPFTKFGFAKLVSILYPLYGIANLYLLGAILLYPITNRYK
jgi:uncharacterized membrane protein YkvI